MPYESAIMALTASGVLPGAGLTTPASTACSAEPIAADMVCDPASMPPAAPDRKVEQLGAENDQGQADHARTTARMLNLSPSPPRLLTKEGPTRRPTPYMNR